MTDSKDSLFLHAFYLEESLKITNVIHGTRPTYSGKKCST